MAMPSTNVPPRAQPQVHVIPGRKGVWSVRATGADSAVSLHSSVTDAEHAAHRYAHTRGATEVVVHDRYAQAHASPVAR